MTSSLEFHQAQGHSKHCGPKYLIGPFQAGQYSQADWPGCLGPPYLPAL